LEVVRHRFQSLAMLDAILMPEWDLRYFSFNSNWGADEMMASMRNGEGDEYFFLFCKKGVVGKIFCHELAVTEPQKTLLALVPPQFEAFLTETAFGLVNVTCCLWQTPGNSSWEIAPPDQGEVPLLAFIQDNGEYYRGWATDYYEQEIPASIIEKVFMHETITDKLLSALPKRRQLEDLISDAVEIGYPIVNGL
jgi:hypothetical protein